VAVLFGGQVIMELAARIMSGALSEHASSAHQRGLYTNASQLPLASSEAACPALMAKIPKPSGDLRQRSQLAAQKRSAT
jgi:hypothetical protein